MDTRNQQIFDFSQASRNTDAKTSHMAEENITKTGKRQTHCKIILHALRRKNGATNKELAVILDGQLTYMQIVRRMRDLLDNGLVEKCDRITREGCCTWWCKI